MNREEPKSGEIWKHFNGEYYKILCIGHHSETKEKIVVYFWYKLTTNLSELEPCITPLEIFMSEVDHEKYPNVKQKYRFKKVQDEDIGKMLWQIHQKAFGKVEK